MTATQSTSAARGRSAPRSSSAPRAFTLTELLVVIALIVMLITLLLAALKAVQNKARETRTSATMRAFGNACDAFQQEQGFYPGVVPENILAYDAEQSSGGVGSISGTENAMLHLTGGFIREADVSPQEWNDPGDGDWQPYQFQSPAGPYRVKVNLGRIGQGPTINGKAYAPYFTPGEREFAVTAGQVTVIGPSRRPLPDVIDAWGQPIVYLRRMRSVGPLTYNGSSPAQFDPGPMRSYTQSEGLGRLGANQLELSILNTAPDPDGTLARILGHPALPGQARGAFMLLSAGPDGVYFSREDGPGSPGAGNGVDDILTDYGPSVIDEYDDVLIFGGD